MRYRWGMSKTLLEECAERLTDDLTEVEEFLSTMCGAESCSVELIDSVALHWGKISSHHRGLYLSNLPGRNDEKVPMAQASLTHRMRIARAVPAIHARLHELTSLRIDELNNVSTDLARWFEHVRPSK